MMLVARSFQRARRVATGPRSALVLPGSSFTGHRLVPIDHTRRRRLSEVVMAAYNLEKFKDFSLLLSQWCTVVNGLQMLKLSLVVAWVMWKQNALTVRQAQAQPKSLKDRFSEAMSVVFYQTTLFCVFFFVLPCIALFYDGNWDLGSVGSIVLDAFTSQALVWAFPQTWGLELSDQAWHAGLKLCDQVWNAGLELSDQAWNTLTKMAQATFFGAKNMYKLVLSRRAKEIDASNGVKGNSTDTIQSSEFRVYSSSKKQASRLG